MINEAKSPSLGTTIDHVNDKVIVNPIFHKKSMQPICHEIEKLENSEDKLSSVMFIPTNGNEIYKNFIHLKVLKNEGHNPNLMFMDANSYKMNFSSLVSYYVNNIRVVTDNKLPCKQVLDESLTTIYTNLDMDDLIKIELLVYNRAAQYFEKNRSTVKTGNRPSKTKLQEIETVINNINNCRLLTSDNFENLLKQVTFLTTLHDDNSYHIDVKGADYYIERSNEFIKNLLIAEKNHLKANFNRANNYDFISDVNHQLKKINALYFTINSDKIKQLQETITTINSRIGSMSKDYDFMRTTRRFTFSPELLTSIDLYNNGRLDSNNLMNRESFFNRYKELYAFNQFILHHDMRQCYVQYNDEQLSSDKFYQKIINDDNVEIKNNILFKIRITPTSMQNEVKKTMGELGSKKEFMDACREKVNEVVRKYQKTDNIVHYYLMDGSAFKHIAYDTGLEMVLKSTKQLSYLKLLGIRINKNWSGQFIVFSNDKADEIINSIPSNKI